MLRPKQRLVRQVLRKECRCQYRSRAPRLPPPVRLTGQTTDRIPRCPAVAEKARGWCGHRIGHVPGRRARRAAFPKRARPFGWHCRCRWSDCSRPGVQPGGEEHQSRTWLVRRSPVASTSTGISLQCLVAHKGHIAKKESDIEIMQFHIAQDRHHNRRDHGELQRNP